ncbi:MAG TPA: MBL fold metallo-hydrolase [Anaerolineales bacterium]|jgi:glyoxylase-like metal-dependent hydrolase (beta-lactamase superfamily II)|nr:MBL fold metallo-hydrolase [Anaerolineales bacterium]
MNILNLGYRSTNYYALEIKSGKLLVDCGWPGMFPEFLAVFKRKGVAPEEIRYILVTHFHMDHAGAVQELKSRGAKLILMESQVGFPKSMADFLRPKNLGFTEIYEDDAIQLKFSESRAFLAGIGMQGEIIPTPGHSDDHVTLILDEGFAFTGDLPPRFLVMDEDQVTKESWDKIYQHKITRIFPAHGNDNLKGT